MDLSGKGLGDIKRNLVFDNVVTSPAELVRHRFDRHNLVAFRFLSLLKALDPRCDHRCSGLLATERGKKLAASLTLLVQSPASDD